MWRVGLLSVAAVLVAACSAATGPTPASSLDEASASPSQPGEPAATADASAEPSTVAGRWQQLDDMSVARWSFAAVELADGRVFVVDQEPCNGMSELGGPPEAPGPADILDPATGRWTPVAPFGAIRDAFAAVLLRDGRVLIVGGDNGFWGAYSSTKLFDPLAGSWSAGSLMRTARIAPVAATLSDGRVLVAGGTYSVGLRDEADYFARQADGSWPEEVALSSAEIYDPATGRWTETASLSMAMTGGSTFVLPDGRVLVLGPRQWSEPVPAVVYDPVRPTWLDAGDVPWLPGSAAAVLDDGSVLIVGGTDDGERSVAAVRRFDPSTGRSADVAALPVPRSESVAAALPDGRVLVAGGSSFDGTVWPGIAPATADAVIYDPDLDRWTPTAPMPFADRPGSATLLADGRVLVTGGSIPFEGEVVDACEPPAVGWTAAFRLEP